MCLKYYPNNFVKLHDSFEKLEEIYEIKEHEEVLYYMLAKRNLNKNLKQNKNKNKTLEKISMGVWGGRGEEHEEE